MYFIRNKSIYSQDNKSPVLKKILASLYDSKFFLYTVLSILVKSVLFLGVIETKNVAAIDFNKGLYSISDMWVYLGFILIFISFSFLFNGRVRLWYLICFNIFVTALIIFDLWYFRGFASFITLHLLKQTTNLDNLSGSIFSMLRGVDVIFIIDIFILIPLFIKYKNLYKGVKRNIILFFLMFCIPICYIAYKHYKVDIIEKGQNQILFRICWTPGQTMANLSPIGYHIYDVYKYFESSRPYILKPEENSEIQQWYKAKQESMPDNKYKGIYKGKNLIVIQVESLENFVINKKINNQEITPNINKLLNNSLYFDNYYEQVYNGTSSDADLMTNTSVYPIRVGSTFFRYPGNTYNSLPKLLGSLGYSTTAIHPDKGSYWNWMPALRSIGFQQCIDASNFKLDEIIGLGLSDGSYLKQVAPIIKQQKPPFYTFLVTLTSHGPFDLPKEYRSLQLDEKLDETKLGGYFQSINYTDKQIGLFLSELKQNNLLDNSVIVLYGDHCGIHKYYEDEVLKIKPIEDWWMTNNKRMPLIIYQNQQAGEIKQVTGGQIDLLPTLSYLFGVDEKNYINSAMGRNLLKTSKNFAVLADKTFIGDNVSEEEKNSAIKGIDISDIIIRSNYFKK